MSTMELVILACSLTAVIGALGAIRHLIQAKESGPPPGRAPSVSILAGLSFFTGLLAVVLVAVAAVLAKMLSMSGMINLKPEAREHFELTARILLYASLVPAVGSAAFAIAARGVISESKGGVFGRALYRTGLLLAVLCGSAVLDARIVNPATWSGLGDHSAPAKTSIDRVYFGASCMTSSDQQGSMVLRLEAGSPAEKAGLRVDDRIIGINNVLLHPMQGLHERLAAFRPGDRVVLEVRRKEEALSLIVELGSSLAQFEPLRDLLRDQSFDNERMTVLKVAGTERTFTVEELKQICKTFDFDDSRLKVMDQALPHLQDPENAYQLLGSLDFTDSKNKLSRKIEELQKSRK